MLREWEFHLAQLSGLDFMPGECHVAALGSGNPYSFWRDDRRVPSNRLHTSVHDAYTAVGVKNNNNNTVFLTPDTHVWATAVTWAKSNTHLVGMSPGGIGNPCKITQSANFAASLVVSGDGNHFKNFAIEHGRGNAANLNALSLTGDFNVFEGIHFNGPFHATEADTAGYGTIDITGGVQNLFKNCIIGSRGFTRGAANTLLRLGAGSFGNTFENCLFLSYGDEATPYFIESAAGLATEYTIFKNCQFIHWSADWGTPLTIAINNAGAADDHFFLFDSQSHFVGVTDVVAATKEATVLQGNGGFCPADENILLSTAFDHTA